jgi:hypothetical protein
MYNGAEDSVQSTTAIEESRLRGGYNAQTSGRGDGSAPEAGSVLLR